MVARSRPVIHSDFVRAAKRSARGRAGQFGRSSPCVREDAITVWPCNGTKYLDSQPTWKTTLQPSCVARAVANHLHRKAEAESHYSVLIAAERTLWKAASSSSSTCSM